MADLTSTQFSLLVVGISWPPVTFLARLIRGLAEAGVDVTVACPQRPDSGWLKLPTFHWLFAPAWQGPIPGRLLRLGASGVQALARSPKDVSRFAAHVHQLTDRVDRLRSWHRLLPFAGRRWDVIYFPWNSAAITYLPLFDLGCPVIVSCRGSQVNIAPHNPQRLAIRDGLRATFQRASAVHCVSEAIKQEAMQYGLDPAKTRVIPPAVDPDFFRPAPQSTPDNDLLRIVTTGSLTWSRGYEYALQAIGRLRDNGIPVRLDLIGDGPERQRLLYTIHDLGLAGQVYLHGRVSPAGVRERLQQADLFMFSGLSAGISNAVLEAMACGLPVVTTDCGGMPEVVTDGLEGLVVPSRDEDAMAEAIRMMWQVPGLRKSMGQAGRKRILNSFALNRQIDQFMQLCCQLVTGQQRDLELSLDVTCAEIG